MDYGAGSVVLSTNAYVLHKTGRYATLVEYDPKHTRSKCIPIIFAYLKVQVHNRITAFVKLNETVYCKANSITLLSEYLFREYGLVIDLVAKNIKNQQLRCNFNVLSEHVYIPFENREGVMSFEVLFIILSEIQNRKPLYIICLQSLVLVNGTLFLLVLPKLPNTDYCVESAKPKIDKIAIKKGSKEVKQPLLLQKKLANPIYDRTTEVLAKMKIPFQA